MHVYVLTNKANGKRYVGQTIYPLDRRFSGHRSKASNSIVSHAIRKYGWNQFAVKACELSTQAELDELEEFLILELRSHVSQNGYNVRWGGNSVGGHKASPETRAKQSAAQMGRVVSEETRRKISETNKKWIRTPEQRAKQAAKLRGRKHTQAHRDAISAGNMGRIFTAETRAKISAAHTGKKRSPEAIENIRRSQIGKKASAETRAKMSAAQRGRKMPPRTKEWREHQSRMKRGIPWTEARRAACKPQRIASLPA